MELNNFKTPKEIINEINESNLGFIAQKKSFPVVHLKGIGRFCKKCSKRIEPKKFVKKQPNGKLYLMIRQRDFCNNVCRNSFYDKKYRKNHLSKSTVLLKITLEKELNGTRKVILYLGGQNQNIESFLNNKESELWRIIDKIEKYRQLPKMEITV